MELAWLSTVLVLLVAGSIDYGNYEYDGILLANAAQAGVQYGAHSSISFDDFTGIQGAATSDAGGITLTTNTASDLCTCSDGTSTGTAISCTAPTACATGLHQRNFVVENTAASFSRLMIFPGISSPITISRTAYMEVSP